MTVGICDGFCYIKFLTMSSWLLLGVVVMTVVVGIAVVVAVGVVDVGDGG